MAALPPPKRSAVDLLAEANRQWRARVVRVDRLTPTIVEVVVEAPAAAKNFEPGQFYRLQNYETFAEEVDGIKLTMEGIALTGAWVDRERGLISLIVLEMGGSSRLCSLLEPGEKIVLMGPTGTPTEIPHDQTVVLAGGGFKRGSIYGLSNATASEPEDNPIGPEDLFYTVYNCLGIVADKELMAPGDRPIEIIDGGKVRKELLA